MSWPDAENPFPITQNGETFHFAEYQAEAMDGVATGGSTSLLTIRTGQTYDELLAEVGSRSIDPEWLSIADDITDDWSHLSWIYDATYNTEYVMANSEFAMSSDAWGRILTHMKSELQEEGHAFNNWNSGIHAHALEIYAISIEDVQNLVDGEVEWFELFAQLAVDAALITY